MGFVGGLQMNGGVLVTLFTKQEDLTGGQTGGQIKHLTKAVQKHLKALTENKILMRIGTHKGYWKVLIKE